jgi:hypothetical protein
MTIKQASVWASKHLNRQVTTSNISYLIQYGKIQKYDDNGSILVDLNDLKRYYKSFHGRRELKWKKSLGDDLNWALSFDHLREKDTTKHVHRLHPYKGKFIPQLVEYFLDKHTDEFKKETYFKKGDIILDPFCGSGTTLVQANEMGMHSIGIDISHFNCMISEVKLFDYNFNSLEKEVKKIQDAVIALEIDTKISNFENELYDELAKFNYKYFPSTEFKYRVYRGVINEDKYAREKEKEFLKIYNRLIKKYGVKIKQDSSSTFLDKWYVNNVRKEIDFAFDLVKQVKNSRNKKIMAIILSRAIRSCRATTHYDLATLKNPQWAAYYCHKHKKICKPIFSIKKMFSRYAIDTIERLKTFDNLRTSAYYVLLPVDSRTVDIFSKIKKRKPEFYNLLLKHKINGIFTSPPYVGQIDYHEQHAYAYDLFGFKRRDKLEIGPLYKGQGTDARKSYVEGISKVLLNCKKYLTKDFNIFLVANDKYNLYPIIAEKTNLKIINKYKRPVLNRTERDKGAYSEIIFHLKEK